MNEVQEAVSSPNDMVQFHALSLLYEIKKNDRLAISKMVTQLTKVATLTSLYPSPPTWPHPAPPTHPPVNFSHIYTTLATLQSNMGSPLGVCLLIRYISKILK